MTSLENCYHSQLSSGGKLLAYLLLLTTKYFHWCFVSVKLTSWITPGNSWPTSLSTQKQAGLDDEKRKSGNDEVGKQDTVCPIQYGIFIYRVIGMVLRLNHQGVRMCIVMIKDYVLCTWLMVTSVLENIWKGKDKVMSHATYETATFKTCHPQISVQQEKNDPFSINAPRSSLTMALTRNPFIFSREIVLRWLLGTVEAWLLRPGLD